MPTVHNMMLGRANRLIRRSSGYGFRFGKQKIRSAMPENAPQIFYYRGLSKNYPDVKVKDAVRHIVHQGKRECFHLTDLHTAENLIRGWRQHLPWIQPYYAIKANPSDVLLGYFNQRNVSFDVASMKEMIQCAQLGVRPENMIFSNPCKTESDLEFAEGLGIELTVFESIGELHKIHQVYPKAHLLVRIKAVDKDAQIQFSHRFGVTPEEAVPLLREAKRLGFEIRGTCFHVGSGVEGGREAIYKKALDDCRAVFDIGEELGYQNMDTVDIGGGFGAEEDLTIIGRTLSGAKDLFPGCRWMAEPGRYLCASTQTAAARVMLTKGNQITINDGLYGTFSCIPYDFVSFDDAEPVDYYGNKVRNLKSWVVFGPSCDGGDVVSNSMLIPDDVKVGDWLVFGSMGAYTQVSSSDFNGIKRSEERSLIEVAQVFQSEPNILPKHEEGRQIMV